MKTGRIFSFAVMTGMAIAGGLFVSDQRWPPSAEFSDRPIEAGDSLRLGILLPDNRPHQPLISTLRLAQEQANRCGGINRAPVLLSLAPSFGDERLQTFGQSSSQPLEPIRQQLAKETDAMSYLIHSHKIHGAIATFTSEPNSYGLMSEALNVAIDSQIPTISPSNTQPLLESESNSPFDRFWSDFVKDATEETPQSSITGQAKATDRFPIKLKRTQYWARTTMSDRQHLMLVAQLAQQRGWHRIAILSPNTPRGNYLTHLAQETFNAWGHTLLSHTSAPPNDSPTDNVPEINGSETPESFNTASNGAPSLELLPWNYRILPVPPKSTPDSTSPPGPELTEPNAVLSEFLPADGATQDLATSESISLWNTTVEFAPTPSTADASPPDVVILFLEPDMFSLSSEPISTETSLQSRQTTSRQTASRQTEGDALLRHTLLSLVTQLEEAIAPQSPPIVLGNSLDTQGILSQMQTETADESTPHPLANLWGIASVIENHPTQFPQKLSQMLPNLPFSPPLHAAQSWDAAVLMMLAAEAAGENNKEAIQAELHNVANPPGVEVTDICEALELIRQKQSINYRGWSGRVDLDGWGNVSPGQAYRVWQIAADGTPQTIETLHWVDPSSFQQ